MQEIAKHIPSISTFVANLVVFLAAIGAAVAGSLAMVRRIKSSVEETFPAPKNGVVTSTQVVGGILQDAFDGKMLSAAVEVNTVAVNEQTDEIRDLRHAVCSLRDELREHRHELQFQRRTKD